MSTAVVVCPRCFSEGQQSTVEAKSVPLMPQYTGGYYDEMGGYHIHNPNNTQVGLECSLGHVFTYAIANKCWCGWKNEK